MEVVRVNVALSSDQRALVDGITNAIRLYESFSAKVERTLASLTLGNPTERRILLELSHAADPSDAELCRILGIEKSQMSKSLSGLERQGLIESKPAPRHKVQKLRQLTAAGRERVSEIYEARSKAILVQYGALSPEHRAIVDEVSGLTFADASRFRPGATILRPIVRHDWPWVFQEMANNLGDKPADIARYAAGIAEFDRMDPSYEMGWIALQNSQKIGVCLAVFEDDAGRAEIPFCYVVRDARGIGVGQELILKCIESSRYHTLSSISARALNPSSIGIVLKRLGFKMARVPAREEAQAKALRRFVLNLNQSIFDC